MTNKPVLNIELNTDQFDAFQKKYAEFKAELDKTPEGWRAVTEEVEAAGETLTPLQTFLAQHLQAMDRVQKKRQEDRDEVVAVGVAWEGLSHYTGLFTSHVNSATASLVKWSGLTAVFSSILGAGGLVGIDRMAAGAGAARSSSAGYGNTYGEQAAFETSFARLGSADTNLSWVNSLQRDAGQYGHLQALAGSQGNADRIRGEDPASAFADVLPKLKQLVDQFNAGANKGNFDQLAQIYGIPVPLARQLAGMSPQELQQMIASYRANAGGLNVPPAVLEKWQDLDRTFDAAGTKISVAFADKLVDLAPGVGAFAAALGDVITYTMRDGGPITGWIVSAEGGLKWLGDELANPDVMRNFEAGVSEFVKALGDIVLNPDPRAWLRQWAGSFTPHAINTPGDLRDAVTGRIIQHFLDHGVAPGNPVSKVIDGAEKAAGEVADRAKAIAKGLFPDRPPRTPLSNPAGAGARWHPNEGSSLGVDVGHAAEAAGRDAASAARAVGGAISDAAPKVADAAKATGNKLKDFWSWEAAKAKEAVGWVIQKNLDMNSHILGALAGDPHTPAPPKRPNATGRHPAANHWAQDAQKPRVHVSLPQGQNVDSGPYSYVAD